jgi:hypothetical protein
LTSFPRGLRSLVLVIAFCPCQHWIAAQQQPPAKVEPVIDSVLPDAPELQTAAAASGSSVTQPPALGAGTLPEAGKYDFVIEPGQSAPRLSAIDKLIFSMRENARIVNIFPALYSTGYEQLRGTDPKYGSDAGAGAARFGASMLLAATTRTLSDGIFAAAFHQDPRYHRIANGSIVHRGLRSAARAFVRHSDDGPDQINASGLVGRAAAAVLTLAYYPDPSRSAQVLGKTFAFSIVTDAGGDLVLEFLPDLARKFPILKRVEFQ